MKQRMIEEWLVKRTQPVPLGEIAKKFNCSKSTARIAAMRMWQQGRVNACSFSGAWHFSRKLT